MLVSGDKGLAVGNAKQPQPLICDAQGRLITSGNAGNGVVWEPTVATTGNATAYTAGDVVGTKMSALVFKTGFWMAYLAGLRITDLDNQKAALTLLFFDVDPSNTTFTDNSALSWGATDYLRVVAQLNIATGDYTTVNSRAFGTKSNLMVPVSGQTSGSDLNLYMAVVTTGTPTYATANSLRIRMWFQLQSVPATGSFV